MKHPIHISACYGPQPRGRPHKWTIQSCHQHACHKMVGFENWSISWATAHACTRPKPKQDGYGSRKMGPTERVWRPKKHERRTHVKTVNDENTLLGNGQTHGQTWTVDQWLAGLTRQPYVYFRTN